MTTFKKILMGLVIVLAIAAGVTYAMQRTEMYATTSPSGLEIERLHIDRQSGDEVELSVEIARTPTDIKVGLMHRTAMPENHGMLFMMSETPKPVAFWMKNTLIPLDMLFVAEDGEIVNIHRRAAPESLSPIPSGEPVTGVIEINGGRADEMGIAIGDKVRHPYFGRQ